MGWLLNAIYFCFLIFASPWLVWRRIKHGKNRRGWSQKLLGNVPEFSEPCIWLHAVSVGEVILLEPIIRELRRTNPQQRFAISTTTETGYDLAQAKFSGELVFFCPIDFTWAINRVLRRIRPSMLVLAELEIWPNLIRSVNKAGIPIAVVNGRLGEKSFRGYRRLGRLLQSTMQNISLVCAQNEAYAERFRELGCSDDIVKVTGSVKFDGAETNRNNAKTIELSKIASIEPKHRVLIAGSTQLEEDLLVAETYKQLSRTESNVRLIIAPRHPEHVDAVVAKLTEMHIPTIHRSELSREQPFSKVSNKQSVESEHAPVLIIDVIGELGAWWGCADGAYVGGSMGRRGGQNMIEPAAYGTPVSFGPNTVNFKEIVAELLNADAAVVVRDGSDLFAFFQRVLNDADWSNQISSRSQEVVQRHLGAASLTAELLMQLVATSGFAQSKQTSDVENAAA